MKLNVFVNLNKLCVYGMLNSVACLEGWSAKRGGLLRGMVCLEGWSA